MPIYEYECAFCSRRFERIQKIEDDAQSSCPECGRKAQRVAASAVAFIQGRESHGMHRVRDLGSSCSLDDTGVTCCGRSRRCDEPPCST
jgi:putative FmdB family regulatory protein